MSIAKSFSEEQKQYFQGFVAGAVQRGAKLAGGASSDASLQAPVGEAPFPEADVYGVPYDELAKEEKIKLEKDSLDLWQTIVENAKNAVFPSGGDVFRYKFQGLFYVAPAQESFMVRLRTPACQLDSTQFRAVGRIAADLGGGYADVTTRGNLQVREIPAEKAPELLMRLDAVGLTSRGSGADNIRNVTASPTCGFDPDEIYDVRPLARALHHTILNSPDLYGIPRKFNVSFDSGGRVSVVADTNDIGFYAVTVDETVEHNGQTIEPGVYFRLYLGGITGHEQFASDTGLLLRPEECVPVTVAMIRVFIEHGNRRRRNKARLKYLLDDWGVPKFLEATAAKLEFDWLELPLANCGVRKTVDRKAHLGIRPQKQRDLFYLGVHVPVGRMQAAQMERLAEVADEFGSGDLRLTVWQSIIIPDVPASHVKKCAEAIKAVGFEVEPPAALAGLVACTGNTGCKFANTNTKGQALILGHHLKEHCQLDQPLNIHLTGCPHSCAQHYCGDLGLLGCKVKVDGQSVEGYHVLVGGGVDDLRGCARELARSVPFTELPDKLVSMMQYYLAERKAGEPFIDFSRRTELADLQAAFGGAQ